jgi:hypothetical protein
MAGGATFPAGLANEFCAWLKARLDGLQAWGSSGGIRLKHAYWLVAAVMLHALPAEALEWRWSYSGEGVKASGALTTTDKPDADGFYAITGVRGEMNGVAITGLQPAGTSIPGNDGYPVDGLIKEEAPHLSLHGFGYALADGTYANPFYGARFAPPGVYAFFSDPKTGKTAEPLVKFTATMAR